jgi:ABC transporter DrrB family efflux protein
MIGWRFSDASALARRSILRFIRSPDVIAFSVIQPFMVLLLFRYIMGGTVPLPNYTEYLLPGVCAFAVLMGSATIGIGLAEDLTSGVADRLRVLPVGRSALLVGRALTDVEKNTIILPLIGGLGLIVGFHFVGSISHILLAGLLLLALGSAFAWISMTTAIVTGSVESTQAMMFVTALVFSFTSSGFVPVFTMPPWLKEIVEINPVTHVDNAVRTLTTTAHGPVGHNIALALIGIAVILCVTIPIAIRRYTRYSQ